MTPDSPDHLAERPRPVSDHDRSAIEQMVEPAPQPAPEPAPEPEGPIEGDSAADGTDDIALGIDMRQVSLRFGDSDVPALDRLDLAVPLGRLTVLLGPNGAGKTTAIRMITGALTPDRGTRRVLGRDPHTEGEAIRRRCGVVSAEPALYERLSGRENLRYSAQLFGVDDSDATIGPAADRFGIGHALDQKVAGYSTGMKTRLTLSRSILHEPELLLLDEPTSGLDPESARAVLDLIAELCADGTTVLMCTHLLSEAEGIADRIVVLDAGRNLVSGTPEDFAQRFGPEPTVRIVTDDPVALVNLVQGTGSAINLSHPAGANLAGGNLTPSRPPIPGVRGVVSVPDQTGDPVVVAVDSHESIAAVVVAMVNEGMPVRSIEPVIPSLEELYFSIREQQRQ